MIVRRNFEIIPVSHYSIDILDSIEVVFYDAPYRAIRMKKTPAINTIFEKVKYKEYEENALLKQDILSYYYQVIKGEKVDNLFRFRDLAMWLMKNNLEFFNYYKGSHVKYRNRIENRKYRIVNALRALMTLGLIRIGGTGKARKVNTDIDMYEYTKGGQLKCMANQGFG